MNKVSFHLKRRNSTQPQTVFALYYVGKRAAKIYTGVSVNPRSWNPKRQRLKASDTHASIFNSRLDQIETDILSIVRDLENSHVEVTIDRIRSKYNELVHKSAPKRQYELLEVFEEWIEAMKASRSSATITVYETTKLHLNNYATARGARLSYDRMDREFVNSFVSYLLRVVQMQNSSLWKIIKTWKTFMGWSVEQGYTTVRFFETVTRSGLSNLGVNVVDPAMVRLTEHELQAIAEVDLTDSPALFNARNLFVLQCTIGVRYGDLARIASAPNNFVAGDTVGFTTQKTRKSVSVPLLAAARRILESQSGLHVISNVKMNQYIKEVAERAGIIEPVVITRFRGVERIDEVIPKYKAITTHTAKRTFVTLMVARGISTEVIMKVTGNSRSTIDRYIYLDDHDVQQEMRKAEDLLTL